MAIQEAVHQEEDHSTSDYALYSVTKRHDGKKKYSVARYGSVHSGAHCAFVMYPRI